MNPDRTPAAAARTAVVVGGSFAGCVCALVLARHGFRVLLAERGDFGDDAGERRGVPQERHVHLFLLGGKRRLEQLLPGFTAELASAGAEAIDQGHGVKAHIRGLWRQRFPTGVSAHYCSRSLIDRTLRRLVRREDRIEVWSGAAVKGVDIRRTERGMAATGVTITRDGQSHHVPAELVIDASGRAAAAREWLKTAGLGPVPESVVRTSLGYASREYRRRPEFEKCWRVLLAFPKPPRERRMGVISPIEGGRWLVTTGGWFGEYPKTEGEFLPFLKSLPVPDIYDAVRSAEPLSGVSVFGFPGSQWRHYERVADWPEGLLVVGDAMCSLNPIYSQGMTVAALQAGVLSDALPDWSAGRLTAAALQARLAGLVRPAWDMAHAEDLRFPETEGDRPRALRLRHWYGARVAELSATHRLTLQTMVGVTNLVTPPRALYRPAIMGRVALQALRRTVR